MTDVVEVTLYTRPGCSLCDKARSAILKASPDIRVREVNIDDDPELRRRYTNDIPVAVIGDVEAFRHRIDVKAFKALIEQRRTGARSDLGDEKCIPCRGGVPPLKGDELYALASQLGNGWRVIEDHHLEKDFTFSDFAQALSFTNAVGAIAEREGHHPDIYLAWGKVRITIWTHKIDGLTRSDFILAAKIDKV
jgi:4a-hydroxytetrahydrobiopterin dehydratase